MNTLTAWDWQLFERVNQGLTSEKVDQLAILLSKNTTWWAVAAGALLLGLVLKKKHWIQAVCLAVLCVGASDALNTYALKPTFGRLRPCHQKTVRLPTGNCGSQFGMPSNHAGNGAAVFSAVSFFLKPVALVGVAIAVALVGWSRVHLGVHFPGDILAGFFIGSLVGQVVSIILIKTITYIHSRHKNNAPH